MSFHISQVENSPTLSKGANEFFTSRYLRYRPSEKLISELPLELKKCKFDPVFIPTITGDCLDAILNMNISFG